MKPATAASALRVQNALGPEFSVVEFEATTKTAEDAARAIGCAVAEIAKSLVFRGKTSGAAILVIASGATRVDERKVAEILGEAIARANPDFVRQASGFAIGGVPPFGWRQPATTLIDADLLGFVTIWGAGGTPNAVFRLTPADLMRLTGGRVADVARRE